jgi:hypothetical protein
LLETLSIYVWDIVRARELCVSFLGKIKPLSWIGPIMEKASNKKAARQVLPDGLLRHPGYFRDARLN